MDKKYVKLKYVQPRLEFIGSLEDLLDAKQIAVWREGKNKYIGFYESVIEYIVDYSYFDQDLEKMKKYYNGFLYTQEETQKVREYGQYIYDWHCKLHPKAK